MSKYPSLLFILVILVVICTGCNPGGNGKDFFIVSGSENQSLEPILKRFGRENGINIHIKYKGSVDIMLMLMDKDIKYDAVWPANSLWITLGDTRHRIKHMRSIMTSPVVFCIRKKLAEKLGWIGKKVRVRDILEAIRGEKFRFMMTSATQSNSGASAYLGFLYSLAGSPEVLTKSHLDNPGLRKGIREILAAIHRSSGSSGWLKDLFIKGNYDVMVNYEAMLIEANKTLASEGKETLYAVYAEDGIVLADSPLGYVNKGGPEKEKIFFKIQKYLLSQKVQNELSSLGRRTGFGGVIGKADESVFRKEWGIDVNRVLTPIRMPSASVISLALDLYQTDFRKPSFTVYCLDYSGSMAGIGREKLIQAMELLLNQQMAKKYLIHAGRDDRTVVIPFSSGVRTIWDVTGNDPATLAALLGKIRMLQPGGATDIYSPVIKGLEILKGADLSKYIPAIILMTDGKSNTGNNYDYLEKMYRIIGLDIPVFGIMFGHASRRQLENISELTRSRLFKSKGDLITAFRKAKGYN